MEYAPYPRFSPLAGWVTGALGVALLYFLYDNDMLQPLPPTKSRVQLRAERIAHMKATAAETKAANSHLKELADLPFAEADPPREDDSAWKSLTSKFENLTSVPDVDWTTLQEGIKDYIVPDWAKDLQNGFRTLQNELNMAEGSLAGQIWEEAQDPGQNPEILAPAEVRVGDELCYEEREFLKRRRVITRNHLADYLGIPLDEIHPDDVPTIAIISSGGGLRALVAGTGSYLAAQEAGLFQCATYMAGVSGSCWLQSLYHSSLGGRRFDTMVDHLKKRLGVHIAYPPAAFQLLNTAPTNKYLLKGFVEKLKGDPNADFGIVDVYGLLLAGRLLVPEGDASLDNRDLKISHQAENLLHGEHPMPIYTAVRHEIPVVAEALIKAAEEKEKSSDGTTKTGKATAPPEVESKKDKSATDKLAGALATQDVHEAVKEVAKQEAWFQWFELTPYELFCEEFGAGIPTWAMGRKFSGGLDVPHSAESGLRVPELKLPLLLGVFGSAMCATLAHYAREVRPVIRTILPTSGWATIQGLLEEREDDFTKVHPIDPASIPNFVLGMEPDELPPTAPKSITKIDHLQLMDAGMSNNLPIYPCLRQGRDVDVIICFDASADIKTENWLQVTEGYAKQRGIKGWPIGAGWPQPKDSTQETVQQLEDAAADSKRDADEKLADAKHDDARHRAAVAADPAKRDNPPPELQATDPADLGYCSVWVGSTAERHTDVSSPAGDGATVLPPPKPENAEKVDGGGDAKRTKANPYLAEDWELTSPDAGVTVVYFPLIPNAAVEGVDPETTPFMSTWNFIYTEADVDRTVELAKANFREGEEQVRRTVRAVYERKKALREKREAEERNKMWKRTLNLGVLGVDGRGVGATGDHFNREIL
jgi:phospholipase A2